ncbi:hypothetical protein J2S34_003075 [Nitrobacter winogradskyi]|uniref:Uncharacterized protein n=1 Tax=Nitrobacter winogradskyi TaxID=913 RepID=A0ACC6AL89_NITWI|nr:hypothetical protein [Nitrobacter winogradskyi]
MASRTDCRYVFSALIPAFSLSLSMMNCLPGTIAQALQSSRLSASRWRAWRQGERENDASKKHQQGVTPRQLQGIQGFYRQRRSAFEEATERPRIAMRFHFV